MCHRIEALQSKQYLRHDRLPILCALLSIDALENPSPRSFRDITTTLHLRQVSTAQIQSYTMPDPGSAMTNALEELEAQYLKAALEIDEMKSAVDV